MPNTSIIVMLNYVMKQSTRLPYSKKEDIAIVQYILKHNYAFDIAGRKMWQMMERSNVSHQVVLCSHISF